MLLIDDDEPELGKRQKQARARPDDDARAAARDGPPGVAAGALRHVGVPLRRQRAKTPFEAVQPLCAERDLG